MSANYWESSQHLYWEDPTFESPSAGAARDDLSEDDRQLITKYPLPEPRLLNLFLQQQVVKLGKRLNIRQVVLATAFVFVKRFYLKVEIRRTNPYLVIATAFYLACKIEECPQHIKVRPTVKLLKLYEFNSPEIQDHILPDTAKLGECEFWLISQIQAQLIIHHPYRYLNEIQTKLDLSQGEMSLAWSVVNDHYVTDLHLRYPPHVIAAMAAVMALTMRPSQVRQAAPGALPTDSPATLSPAAAKLSAAQSQTSLAQAIQSKGEKLKTWLSESRLDIDALVDCTQHMISLYVLWERYNEKECKDQILRFTKSVVVVGAGRT